MPTIDVRELGEPAIADILRRVRDDVKVNELTEDGQVSALLIPVQRAMRPAPTADEWLARWHH